MLPRWNLRLLRHHDDSRMEVHYVSVLLFFCWTSRAYFNTLQPYFQEGMCQCAALLHGFEIAFMSWPKKKAGCKTSIDKLINRAARIEGVGTLQLRFRFQRPTFPCLCNHLKVLLKALKLCTFAIKQDASWEQWYHVLLNDAWCSLLHIFKTFLKSVKEGEPKSIDKLNELYDIWSHQMRSRRTGMFSWSGGQNGKVKTRQPPWTCFGYRQYFVFKGWIKRFIFSKLNMGEICSRTPGSSLFHGPIVNSCPDCHCSMVLHQGG